MARISKGVGTRGLIGYGEVDGADLVPAIFAGGIVDVIKDIVHCDIAVGFPKALAEVIHGVGSSQRNLAIIVEEMEAVTGVNKLVVHVTSDEKVLLGRGVGEEVVPGVVGDVMGTHRRVNFEKVDPTLGIRDLDADVVAGDGARPVSDAVGVNLASEDTGAG